MLIFFFSWYIISLLVNLPIIPSPIIVLKKLSEIFTTTILEHSLYSLWRILVGLILAFLLGYPLGVFLGYVPRMEKIFSPLIYLLYPIPKISLLPLAMLFFGVGEISKILMIILIVIFQVVLAVRDSVKKIPTEYYDIVRPLGASFYLIFRHIIWQAVLPKLFTALRIGLATSISILFFNETFGTEYGMGFFIMDAFLRINYVEMYAGILVLSCIGIFLFTFIDILEYLTCRWQNLSRE